MSYKSGRSAETRSARRKVLLAEDDSEMRAMLSEALRKQGYLLTECQDGVQLLLHLDALLDPAGRVEYDLIISDIRMPGLTGMEIIEGLVGCDGRPPVVLITAFGDRNSHEAARRCGVAALLDKPFEIEDLLAVIRRVLTTQQ